MTTLDMFPRELVIGADNTDCWNTPRDLAIDLGHFDLDVCSNPNGQIDCSRSFQLERGEDGLAEDWGNASVWCNGPYSNPLPWCERLRVHRAPWCSLWKLDTTTAWFEQLMFGCDAWAPFRNRIKFVGAQHFTANFASVLVWGFGWQPSPALLRRLWPPSKGILP